MVRVAFQRRIRAFADDLDERMAAEMRFEAGSGPDVRFKREDHDELAAVFRNARDVGFPPHPDLRTDEPDDGNAEFPKLFGEADVESGVVDHHDDVGTLRFRPFDALEENPDERADLFQDLNEADHSQFG